MDLPFKLRYVWMFVTERCNLNCTYCFYKGRDHKTTTTAAQLKGLLDDIPISEYTDFVFSGGEPLMAWDVVKEAALYIRKKFPEKSMLIQTNGALLDREKLAFCVKNDIGLEFGIDGEVAHSAHRTGTSSSFHDIVKKNIKIAKEMGIRIMATVTIHPKQAHLVQGQTRAVWNMGIPRIETTPATFERWNNDEIRTYLTEYKKLVHSPRSPSHHLESFYDSIMPEPTIDMITLPGGGILPCWSSLSHSRGTKPEFCYARYSEAGITLTESWPKLKTYLEKLYSSGDITYREYSTANTKPVYDEYLHNGEDLDYESYVELCRGIKAINQSMRQRNAQSIYHGTEKPNTRTDK